MLPKYHVKISQEKKWLLSFYFNFCEKHFKCKSMEIGILEGAITFILTHYKARFDLKRKINNTFFFHEICTNWRVTALVHSMKVSNQEAGWFFFFLMFYTTVLQKQRCAGLGGRRSAKLWENVFRYGVKCILIPTSSKRHSSSPIENCFPTIWHSSVVLD